MRQAANHWHTPKVVRYALDHARMLQLILYALTATLTAIYRISSASVSDRTEVGDGLMRLRAGDTGAIASLIATADRMAAPDPRLSPLRRAVTSLGPHLTALSAPTVTPRTRQTAASAMAAVARAVEELHLPDEAYNLYESSYSIGVTCGARALPVARKLRELSKPDRQDQLRTSLWREAIEQLRESLATSTEWIEAIDRVELALTLPVANPLLQQQLYEQLMSVVTTAEHSPIAELAFIVPVQAPRQVVDTQTRRRVGALLGSARLGAPPTPKGVSTDATAAILAQTRVDDLRIKLLGVPPVRASLSWRDLTLTHRQLTAAVPLGRSLTADVDRTGNFALTLVHELGHAYCLLGPVGWAFAALYAGIEHIERAAAACSANETARLFELRERQLSLALRCAALSAVWRPWLEGVSLYLELLCDPTESQGQILAPFAALRSLIDLDVPFTDGESTDEWAERFAARLTEEFEGFYGNALRKHSRRHHVDSLAVSSNPDRLIYLSGYLLARSLAARWRDVVGRPITHVQAARLILDATRNGTFEAIPPLSKGKYRVRGSKAP
jgi:hypothetical protein